MKKNLLIIFIAISTFNSYSQNQQLTNRSISDMVDIGFSDDVIIAKIKTSSCLFDTDIETLKSLKESGVSNEVITAMIESTSLSVNNSAIGKQNSGIYVKIGKDLKRLYPTPFSGGSTNTLGSALTYGIASSDVKTIMLGAHSKNVIKTQNPEFYFRFNYGDNLNSANWWFSTASSPSEFILIKLETKGDKREMYTGSANVYTGTSWGINEKSIVKFTIETLSDYEFKVIPEKPLPAGEYCFIYQGMIPQGGYVNMSAFDFSIPSVLSRKPKYEINDIVYIKTFLLPSEATVIGYKEVDNDIVYTIRYGNTGMVEDIIEGKCFSSSDEARSYKKPKYDELEKEYRSLNHKYEDCQKKIVHMEKYIKDLQDVISSLNKKIK